jgi:hypothetical protein
MVSLGVLFVAYFVPRIADVIGFVAVPMFAVGFLWTGFSTQRDLMTAHPDPELSHTANMVGDHLGVVLGVLVFTPLLGFAAVAAARTW